jgi:hypothetical protein
LAVGAISALVGWLTFLAELTSIRWAFVANLGVYLFWGSMLVCSIAAITSAFAGWNYLSRKAN